MQGFNSNQIKAAEGKPVEDMKAEIKKYKDALKKTEAELKKAQDTTNEVIPVDYKSAKHLPPKFKTKLLTPLTDKKQTSFISPMKALF